MSERPETDENELSLNPSFHLRLAVPHRGTLLPGRLELRDLRAVARAVMTGEGERDVGELLGVTAGVTRGFERECLMRTPARELALVVVAGDRVGGLRYRDVQLAADPEGATLLVALAELAHVDGPVPTFGRSRARWLVQLGVLLPGSRIVRRVTLDAPPLDAARLLSGQRGEWVRSPHLCTSAESALAEVEVVAGESPVDRLADVLWQSSGEGPLKLPVSAPPEFVQVVHDVAHRGLRIEALPSKVLDQLARFGAILPKGEFATSSAELSARLSRAHDDFQRDRFVVLRHLLDARGVRRLGEYYESLLREGQLRRPDGELLRWTRHDETVARALQRDLTPWVSEIVGRKLAASYAFIATYERGADLPRHTDREQCVVNVSFQIASRPSEVVWPLWLDTPIGRRAAALSGGDAVIYEGTRTPHWRDRLELAERSTLLFFHYVPEGFAGPRT